MHHFKSFASLKKQCEKEERAFAYLRKSYSYLSHLSDTEILQFFDLNKREDIVRYRVLTKQTSVVLDNNADEVICLCRDSDGNGKLLYVTYDEAEQKRLFLEKEQQIKLKVYACPTSNGWHLSKV